MALCAGFVDAVVGGGGLIQLPALMVTFPQAALPTLFGTNKFASCVGTSVAALRYGRSVSIPWTVVGTATAFAFVASFLGARSVSLLNPSVVRPLVVLVLFGVLLFTLFRPHLGVVHAPKLSHRGRVAVGSILGLTIGFYDGFIGPGTGSFLLFSFVALLGFDFLHASACAKVVNIGTNVAALMYFIPTGNVRYELAIFMAVANMAGAYLGAHLSMKRGVYFIRLFFILIVLALLTKQIQQLSFSN